MLLISIRSNVHNVVGYFFSMGEKKDKYTYYDYFTLNNCLSSSRHKKKQSYGINDHQPSHFFYN